jgi:hypothetical protein
MSVNPNLGVLTGGDVIPYMNADIESDTSFYNFGFHTRRNLTIFFYFVRAG